MRACNRPSRARILICCTSGYEDDIIWRVLEFNVRTCVKFTFANKIEAMHEGSLVSVKVEPRSASRLSSALFILPLFYLRY